MIAFAQKCLNSYNFQFWCGCAGVLLGTIIIAVLTKYTFPYGWSWTEALLFGAMMAATDPVATVAVLEEVCVCSTSDEQCYIWFVGLSDWLSNKKL